MIPNKSEASIKDGTWFIHQDGENTIQIWGSNLNGKEKVYLNNDLVSEQRSIKLNNSHEFKDNTGQHYEVCFKTESLVKGTLKCTLLKEKVVLKTFKTRYIRGNNFNLKRILILLLASILFAVLKITFEFSDSMFFLFLFMVLVVFMITRDKGTIHIEEDIE